MESRLAVILALSANAAIALMKFVVGLGSGSSSMLSEAIHSTIDTADQLLLLLGMRLGKRPADDLHPFGYGQEVYFWSTVVAVLIFAFGGGMSLLEGIYRVAKPGQLENPVPSYLVLGGAAIFEGISFAFGLHKLRSRQKGRTFWRTYRESKDPSLLTVVTEDAAALVGLVFAFCGVFFSHLLQRPWLDGAAAIAVGLLMVAVSVLLARETRSLLLGETASEDVVEGVRRIAQSDGAVEHVGGIYTMHFGPDQILLNVDVQFRRELTAAEIERAVDRIEDRVRHAHPRVKRIFVEVQSSGGQARESGEPASLH